jgi:hypothetical protein
MTPDDEIEELLRTRFAGVRETDRRQTPAFAEMMARARAAVSAEEHAAPDLPAVVSTPPTRTLIPRRNPWRWAFAAAPLAVAAGLAAVYFAPSRSADREFERVVSEWSRTERTMHAPTDGLLAVPGSEYLRRLPPLAPGAGATRRPS